MLVLSEAGMAAGPMPLNKVVRVAKPMPFLSGPNA
jgi:hypothetical protein